MPIVRRYFGDTEWEPVDDETTRRVLAGYFVDVELAMTDIAAGYVLSTVAAEYKREPVEALRQQKELAE